MKTQDFEQTQSPNDIMKMSLEALCNANTSLSSDCIDLVMLSELLFANYYATLAVFVKLDEILKVCEKP